jgi:hypothetical protein
MDTVGMFEKYTTDYLKKMENLTIPENTTLVTMDVTLASQRTAGHNQLILQHIYNIVGYATSGTRYMQCNVFNNERKTHEEYLY